MAKLGDRSDPVANTAKAVARQIIAKVPKSQQSTVLLALAERIKPGSSEWFKAQSKYGYERALTALIANSYANMLMTGRVPDYISSSSSLGFSFSDITDTAGDLLSTVASGAKTVGCTDGAGMILGGLIGGIAALYSGGTAAAAVPAGAAVGTAGQGALKPVLGCSSGRTAQKAVASAPAASFPWKFVIGGSVGVIGLLGLTYLLAAGGKRSGGKHV